MSVSTQLKFTILILLIAAGLLSYGFISGCGLIGSRTPDIIINDPVIPLSNGNPAFNDSTHEDPYHADPAYDGSASNNSPFIIPIPKAPGTLTESNDRAFVDYSFKHHGYVTIGFADDTDKMLRVLIISPGGHDYIYNLDPGVNEVFPLSDGDGKYTISIHEHKHGNIFTDILAVTIDVIMINEFAPFVRPNQYVFYCKDSPVTAKAIELSMESTCFLSRVEAIYNYVVENIAYDFDLAETVEGGYTPDLDTILNRGSGICFDIAALTAAMLRSQGIPAKLVFGNYYNPNFGNIYHAWVSVFAHEDGWVGEHSYFTSGTWNILDPTVASILGMGEIGINGSVITTNDGSIYHALYFY